MRIFFFRGRGHYPVTWWSPVGIVRCSYRMKISSCVVFFIFSSTFGSLMNLLRLRRGAVIINTVQLHSIKSELRFCTGSSPSHGVSEICDVENFWQWSQLLEIKLNAFLRSTILQKQFIIIVICLNEGAMKYLIVFINYQSRVSLIQNSVLVSWIGQSNEYQEILETQGLIANCPLEMGLSDWGSWIQSIKRGHLNFSF